MHIPCPVIMIYLPLPQSMQEVVKLYNYQYRWVHTSWETAVNMYNAGFEVIMNLEL